MREICVICVKMEYLFETIYINTERNYLNFTDELRSVIMPWFISNENNSPIYSIERALVHSLIFDGDDFE